MTWLRRNDDTRRKKTVHKSADRSSKCVTKSLERWEVEWLAGWSTIKTCCKTIGIWKVHNINYGAAQPMTFGDAEKTPIASLPYEIQFCTHRIRDGEGVAIFF